jgi:hypothetical protein
MPTDLSGLTQVVYDRPPREKPSREVWMRTLATPSDIIRDRIRDLGVSREKARGQIREVAAEQQRQAKDLDVIKLILNLVLPEYERWHLGGLAANPQTYLVQVTQDIATSFESELRHLLSHGLVERQDKKELKKFFMQEGQQRNLAEYLKITPKGREYIEIYQRFAATMPGHLPVAKLVD